MVNEIKLINRALDLMVPKVADKIVKIKLKEVQQQLNQIPKDTKIRDKHLVSLLRSYNLVKELKNVVK